jgi:ribonuclease P protein component
MIPQKRKVDTGLFPSVLKQGNSISSEHFSLRFLRVPGVAPSKFSFVVSRKISKKAVERNRLKRHGYAALEITKHPPPKTSIVAIFFAKKNATKLSYQKIKNEVGELLKKAGILNTP